MKTKLFTAFLGLLSGTLCAADFRIEHNTVLTSAGAYHWAPSRSATMPGKVVVTSQEIEKRGSHGCRDIYLTETIFRKARAAGIGAGIHFWGSIEQQTRFLKLGANMLIHSADISLFQKHLRLELAAIRRTTGVAACDSDNSNVLI